MKFFNKHLILVFLLALFVRVVFFFFGGEIFFGIKDFYFHGDSSAYTASIINLIEKGVFTVDIYNKDAYAARMPGYPFFLGIFFLIFGHENLLFTLKVAVFFQILLSSFSSILFYKIVFSFTKNSFNSLIAGVLFATYPFAVVWSTVIYAESFSIDILVIIFYLLVVCNIRLNVNVKYLFVGILSGISFLVRPQLIFLFAAVPIYLYASNNFSVKNSLRQVVIFFLSGFLMYSSWPIRNYINFGKPVLVMNLSTSRFMSYDRLNFAYFMWSVKTDWEPQMSQLLKGEEVEMPSWVWKISVEDSIKIKKAISLSYNCSDGFRQLRKLPPLPKEEDCTEEVAKNWEELRNTVKHKRPLKYYLIVPLGNLKKAMFKNSLLEGINKKRINTKYEIVTKLLFLYRTVLLILGVVGIFYFLLKSNNSLMLSIATYSACLYFWLCFIYRDMDIRYLLPADILLLIPASYILKEVYQYIRMLFGRKAI